MLRRFFNMYILKEMNSGKFFNIKEGLTSKIENSTNLILLAPILGFICYILNWVNAPKRYFVIRKVWMPSVRIDATIIPSVLKKYLSDKDEE